jgi:hypothetical protein
MNITILRIYPESQHYRNLIAETISVLIVIPAFMFFIQRRPATILGIIIGGLRLTVPFFNGGPVRLINEKITIFMWIGWTITLLAWLVHIFRIHKQWKAAPIDL